MHLFVQKLVQANNSEIIRITGHCEENPRTKDQ